MCNAFVIIHFFNITVKQSGLLVRLAAEIVIDKLINGVNVIHIRIMDVD